MALHLKNGIVEVKVLDPQGRLIAQADREAPIDQTELPSNGDYMISVENQQPAVEQFSLDVEVVTPTQPPLKNTPSRIQFAPGATGAQLNNTVPAGQVQQFLLNAGAQQLMRVNLAQGDIQLNIFSPQGQPLGQLNPQAANWQGQLPQSGDYRLEVSASQTSSYSIKIDIE